MIGVAQHKRGIDILEVFGREGLDRRLRANGRKDRRDEVAVRCGEYARAGAVAARSNGELEHWENCNGRERGVENWRLAIENRRIHP